MEISALSSGFSIQIRGGLQGLAVTLLAVAITAWDFFLIYMECLPSLTIWWQNELSWSYVGSVAQEELGPRSPKTQDTEIGSAFLFGPWKLAQLHAATACACPCVHSCAHIETGYDEIFFSRFKDTEVQFWKLNLPFGISKYMVWPDEHLTLRYFLVQNVTTFECMADWGKCLCAVCPSATTIITSGTSSVVCVWEFSLVKDKVKCLNLRQVSIIALLLWKLNEIQKIRFLSLRWLSEEAPLWNQEGRKKTQ